jgi:hypothetical protein
MNQQIKQQKPVSEKVVKIKKESVSVVMTDKNGNKTQIKI